MAVRDRRYEEARDLFAESIASFETIEAHYYVAEARARLAECAVLEGSHAEAIELATGVLADDSAAGAVRILAERVLGYALHQARRPDEARPHFEESLRLAREANSDYEAALTLRAIADTSSGATRVIDLAGGADGAAMFARLGVASLPAFPSLDPGDQTPSERACRSWRRAALRSFIARGSGTGTAESSAFV